MVPIVTSNDQKFDDESFKDYILSICQTHKNEQRALAFAFIVYDFDDHTITKILDDKKYWSVLDKLSGQYLSVFYVNSQDEYYTRRQQEIYQEEQQRRAKNARKGYISYFVPLALEVTPLDKTVELIKRDFQIDENINHPFVLFFQTQGDTIIDYFIISLKKDRVEDAFLELKTYLRHAVEGIKKVTPENFENHQEIFDLLKGEVKSGKFYDFVSKRIISKLSIGTIISLVKTLAGH